MIGCFRVLLRCCLVLPLIGPGCKDESSSKTSAQARAQPDSEDVASPDQPEAARRSGPPVRKDGTIFADTEMMGTRVSINVWIDPGRDPSDAQRAVEAAFDEMARIEGLLSEWQPGSELSRLNRAAGGPPLKVGPELIEVLGRSVAISEETQGLFDVTFHAVGQLWSFQPGAAPPTHEAIERKLPLVDHRAIEIDPEAGTVRLARPGMMVGLGAIGKGYAAERASAVLVKHGFTNHVVEAGGDTQVSGKKAGEPWVVGVQNPDGPGVVGVLRTTDRAVVTSGGYQRFFEHEGRRYAHIIDPRTGWPIELERSARSVTLVASDPTDADAYCTAVILMGEAEGMAFVESKPDLEAVMVTRSGELLVSSGLGDVFIETTPQGKPIDKSPN
jgi:FAD:protein FMN transferase